MPLTYIYAIIFIFTMCVSLLGGTNAIIWGADRSLAEPINAAHLSRAHADCHGNGVITRNVGQHVGAHNVVLCHH
jgi:hypothetical protein